MRHAADYALYMKEFWFHEGEPGRAASPIGYLLSVALTSSRGCKRR
jgi:hypothetical protein